MRLWLIVLCAALLLPLAGSPAQAAGPVRIATLPLTLQSAPVWSYQQDRLAYLTSEGLFVLRRNGTGLVQVRSFTAGVRITPPVWNGDGRYLAFFEGDRIRVIDSRTGAPGPAYELPQGAEWPAFSSDGRFLVSLSRVDNVLTAHILNLKTGVRRDVPGAAPTHARFSDDCDTLFFLDGDGYHTVKSLDLVDQASRPVTLFSLMESAGHGTMVQAYDLAVSDNMVGLLTNTPYQAQYSLYTYRLDTGVMRYLANDVKEFDLNSNGEIAYISHGDYALEQIDLTYGIYFNIDWGKTMYLRYAPQEDCLAYVKFSATARQLWLYIFADKVAPAVPAAPVVLDAGIDWVEVEIPAAAHPWFRVHVNGAPHAAVASGSGPFRIDGLAPGSDLQIQFSAIDFGHESGLSAPATTSTGDGAPAPPTAIFPFDLSVESFAIRFEVSGQYEKYRISIGGGEPIETVEREHRFTGLAGATTYRVEVACVNGDFVSAPLAADITTAPYPAFAPAIAWPVADGALLSVCPPLAVAVSDPYLAGFAVTLNGAPLEADATAPEGAHTLAVVATDRGGQTFSAAIAFTIDATAPEIVFVNFADGDTRLPGFVPEIALLDASPATYTLFLDGLPLSAGTALPEGSSALRVEAVDAAGNEAVREATLTVAWPAIALSELALSAVALPVGSAALDATCRFDLGGLPGELLLELLDGGQILAATRVDLDGTGTGITVTLTLEQAGAPLPAGEYTVRATLTDRIGRSAGPRSAAFSITDRAQISAERIRNERALLFPHQKDHADAEALLAAAGLPFVTLPHNKPFSDEADRGRAAIHLVQHKRLNAFLLDSLMPRVKAGDLLLLYGDSAKGLPGQGKKNAVSYGRLGAGLLVQTDELNPASLADALARHRALTLPEDRFGAARMVLVRFLRDDAPAALDATLAFEGCAVETAAGAPLAPGATIHIPASGIALRLQRADDLAAARIRFASAAGEGGQVVWAPLSPLADEALLLANALDAAEAKHAASRALLRKAALLARSLFSVRDGDLKSLKIAGAALSAIQAALAVIEKHENRAFAEIDAPLLALDLRVRKALAGE